MWQSEAILTSVTSGQDMDLRMKRARWDLNPRPLRDRAHYSCLQLDRRLDLVESAALSVFRLPSNLRYGPDHGRQEVGYYLLLD